VITADLGTGTYEALMFCPTAGKIAVGGSVVDTTINPDLVSSGGANGGTLGGGAASSEWDAFFTVTTGGTDSVTGQIVCANAPVGSAAQPHASPATSRFVKLR
jgi:hypothetical protein